MFNNLSLKNKLFLLFVFVIAFAVGVIGWIGFSNAKEANIRASYEHFGKDVSEIASKISGMLTTIPDDLTFNNNLYSLRRYLIWKDLKERYKTKDWKDAYINNMKEYLRSSKDYYLARVLDTNGKEIFFLRYDAQKNIVKVEKAQQDKSKKNYFKKAISLPRGAFYISRFDLNMEHGVIERPYHPVVRFSTPIINENGERFGVLVLNFDGNNILRYIKDAQAKTNTKSQKFFLLNKEGYYLYNEDEMKMWGFQKDGDYRFQNDYPDVFTQIKQRDQSTFEKNGHIFSVQKIYPDVKNAPERFWYLVSVVDSSVAFASLRSFMSVFTFALLVVITFGLFLINRYISKVTTPLEKVTAQLNALAKGEIVKNEISYGGNDEVGQIVKSTQVVVESTEFTIHQTKAVANGEFGEDIRLLGSNDRLGHALREMLIRLKEITDISQKISMGNYNIHVSAKSSRDKLGLALVDMVEYLKGITTVAESIESGEIDIDYRIKSDEDRLGIAMMKMISYLKSIRNQANAISNNDFSQTINVKSKNDELGQALVKMTRLLKENYDKNKKDIWLGEGTGTFSDALTGVNDTMQLAKEAIRMICRYIDAASGVVYDVDNEKKELHLIASYAFTKRKTIENKIEFGEGIVGQVALERETILLTNVKDEIEVYSGTTVAKPKEIYAFPLVFEEELFGVVEIASFEGFDELKREYLERIAVIFATYMRASYQSDQIKILLEESRRAYEELQKQSEELQATNKELEEKQKQLALQAQEMQRKNEELQTAKEDIDKKAKELARSSKYKSEFLANMSHELRTPLNSIILLSKLMAQNKNSTMNEEERKKAEVIHKAGVDLLNLINDILDLSKIESGKMELYYETFSSDEIVQELEGLFGEVAKQKNLSFEIEDRCQSVCTFDKTKLMQILKNLLSNAFKFTKQGGVKVVMTKETDRSVFEVQDSGIGIPKEKLETIFEAFRQVDGSISREFGGTGLGLSITKRFVELMHGEIEVESTEGEGTLFRIILPVQNVENASASLPDTTKREIPKVKKERFKKSVDLVLDSGEDLQKDILEGKNILIVDDDSKNIFILEGFLQDFQAETFSALNGQEAIEILQEEKIDAVLVDLLMPVMDGIDFIKRMKEDKRFEKIPVIVITVVDDEKTRQELQDLGVTSYFVKPIESAELIKALR